MESAIATCERGDLDDYVNTADTAVLQRNLFPDMVPYEVHGGGDLGNLQDSLLGYFNPLCANWNCAVRCGLVGGNFCSAIHYRWFHGKAFRTELNINDCVFVQKYYKNLEYTIKTLPHFSHLWYNHLSCVY